MALYQRDVAGAVLKWTAPPGAAAMRVRGSAEPRNPSACAQRHRRAGRKLGHYSNDSGIYTPVVRLMLLLIIGVLLTAIIAALIYRARVPGGVNDAQLGWVSERWLAEHRASTRR